MAFALLMWKSFRIESKRKRLMNEQRNALKLHAGLRPEYSLSEKYSHFVYDCTQAFKNFFTRIFSFPKNSCLHRTSVKMRNEGTLENYIFKSFVGFVSGFFLIYIFFMFFVIILNFSLSGATCLCVIFGSILTIGLAFSQRVRCVVFLILPQFFSKRGRQALLTYAFILTLTGPVKNTLNNMGILSESLACGQEQLKEAVRQIVDVIKKPFIAIKEAIKKVIEVIKIIVKKIKEIFLAIKRIVMSIVQVIKSVFQFLSKIFNICSKKVGTPYERCSKVFENAVLDCQAKLGPMFSWVCSIAYVVQAVCYIVKPLDLICMLIDFISTSIIGVIIRKIRIFVRHIRSTFYVRIRFSHSFAFETTQSKTMKDVANSILAELRERTRKLNEMFDLISSATSLFFLVVILKALYYRYKFLTVDRFDNKYITNNLRNIDFRRAQMEKETILPLNYRERKKYVNITSLRLVKTEKKKLSKSVGFLISVTFKIGTQMAIDYCLYWLLSMIRYHGRYKTTVQAPQTVGINVEGNGFLAELYRSIVKAFRPLGVKMDLDTIPCLPDAIPPNYDKYIQIAFIIFLCLIMTVFEPYGLRFRNGIMCYYHPARAKERAVWLYNHLLRNRNSFLKFARRQLKRKFLGQKGITKITCKEFLRAKINVKWLRFCLGSDRQETCVLCAEVFREGEEIRPIRCSRPGCPGLYCERCFTDLQNLCTICLEPIQYGDLSDVDEEKDSSEDEFSGKYKRKINKTNGIRTQDFDLLRLKGGEEFSDSESDSTEYSISYQYDNSYKNLLNPLLYYDVEKQFIPDYVSMEMFRELKLEDDSSSTLSSWKRQKVLNNNYFSTRNKVTDWLRKKTNYFNEELEDEEEIPLLTLNEVEESPSSPRDTRTDFQPSQENARMDRFFSVHYDSVNESSSDQMDCSNDVKLRRRRPRTRESEMELTSFCTSEEFSKYSKRYEERIKRYYKNIKEKTFD